MDTKVHLTDEFWDHPLGLVPPYTVQQEAKNTAYLTDRQSQYNHILASHVIAGTIGQYFALTRDNASHSCIRPDAVGMEFAFINLSAKHRHRYVGYYGTVQKVQQQGGNWLVWLNNVSTPVLVDSFLTLVYRLDGAPTYQGLP